MAFLNLLSWEPLAAVPDFHLYTGKSQFRLLLLELSLFPAPLYFQAESVKSNCFSAHQAGLLLSPKIHLLSQQVCPLQTSSEDFLMWWEYSTNTQKFWKDWCLPLKSLVADIPTLLSGAAVYPALFSGVAQQYKSFHELGALCESAHHPCKVTLFFRFWDCNTQFCNFKTFLLLSLVVIILLYNSGLSLLIPSSEIIPCLSCRKLSFSSEMMLVWFSRVPYELIDFVMLKFTFGLETKLPRCQWRNLNSLNRILFSCSLNQWDRNLACYIQYAEKFLVVVYNDGMEAQNQGKIM